MKYTVTRDGSGTVIACGTYTSAPAPLAAGQSVCDLATYQSAASALLAPTLRQQATAALSDAQAATWNNYGSLGQSVPASWISYQQALRAIVSGSDTTSTVLPLAPAA